MLLHEGGIMHTDDFLTPPNLSYVYVVMSWYGILVRFTNCILIAAIIWKMCLRDAFKSRQKCYHLPIEHEQWVKIYSFINKKRTVMDAVQFHWPNSGSFFFHVFQMTKGTSAVIVFYIALRMSNAPCNIKFLKVFIFQDGFPFLNDKKLAVL